MTNRNTSVASPACDPAAASVVDGGVKKGYKNAHMPSRLASATMIALRAELGRRLAVWAVALAFISILSN
jgi:hypothetical protein